MLAAAAAGLPAPAAALESPAAPEGDPGIIRAVRTGDSALLRAILGRGADLSVRDSHGDTALHIAAYRGDAAAVDALLEGGAKPNTQDDDGATPLLYGTGNEAVVRALLKRRANPNLASKLELTPLMSAAAHRDSHRIVSLLLDAGADTHVKKGGQEYVALKAVYGGDPQTLALLLDHGASPQQFNGIAASPLAMAAYFGDEAAMTLLLEHGANVNFDSDFAGHALNWALYSGHTALAAELIGKGADLHFKSPWGHQTPPMVFAGYNEHGDPTIARLLLERGANVNEANEAGATALTFAMKSGPHSRLVAFLEQAGARTSPPVPSAKARSARHMPDGVPVGERAQRAIALLQRASTGFIENRFVRDEAKCVSCHHEYLPAVAFAWGAERGLHIDEAALGHQLAAQLQMWRPLVESAREMEDPIPDPPVQIGYGLMGLHALGYAPDAMTEAFVRYLVNAQSPDGSWHWTDLRPPLEGDRFAATAWAVRAVQLYPLPHSDDDTRACMSRARRWLRKTEVKTFCDQVSQLMGLAWAGESPWRLRRLAASVLEKQRPDGVADMAGPPLLMSFIVPWNSPAKSADDLKGKRIGISTVNSLTQWLALELARQKGWGPDGLTFVTVGAEPAPQVAALVTGQIDALVSATALGLRLETEQRGRDLFPASDVAKVFMIHAIYASNKIVEQIPTWCAASSRRGSRRSPSCAPTRTRRCALPRPSPATRSRSSRRNTTSSCRCSQATASSIPPRSTCCAARSSSCTCSMRRPISRRS